MRSHATGCRAKIESDTTLFQYRKRYEVTCDEVDNTAVDPKGEFQYRKRYEVTCDFL